MKIKSFIIIIICMVSFSTTIEAASMEFDENFINNAQTSFQHTFFAPVYMDKSDYLTLAGVLSTAGLFLIADKNYPISKSNKESLNFDKANLNFSVVFVGLGLLISKGVNDEKYTETSKLAVISGVNSALLSIAAKAIVPQKRPQDNPTNPYNTYAKSPSDYNFYNSAFYPTGLAVSCATAATYGYAYAEDKRWLGWILGIATLSGAALALKNSEYWLSTGFISCMSGVYIAKSTLNNSTKLGSNNKAEPVVYVLPVRSKDGFEIKMGVVF